MKKLLALSVFICVCGGVFAQNIIIQQNNNTQQQEKVKVVEKKVYVPVEVEKKPQGPVLLFGYLTVYPEDLGTFWEYPINIITALNKNRVFGKSSWRLPTDEELALMQQKHKEINLVQKTGGWCMAYAIYWTQETLVNTGGKLENSCGARPIRLVCTE